MFDREREGGGGKKEKMTERERKIKKDMREIQRLLERGNV
jgi:hypothetical protein